MANKEDKKKDKKKKENKVGIWKRFTEFLKSVWFELKKVTWPTKPDLMQHTSVVLGIVVIMTLVVWIMDMGIGGLLSLII